MANFEWGRKHAIDLLLVDLSLWPKKSKNVTADAGNHDVL